MKNKPQHLTLFNKLAAAQTLGLILSVAFAVFGQAPKSDEASELPPTQTLERQMTGAETHTYKISLQKDDFFQVRVEQKSVDVALKLLDASGKELATMDSPNNKEGPETLSFVAGMADSYLLEVSGFDAKAAKGNYTIRREASRTATTSDRKRVSVERSFVEGMTAQNAEDQSETAITKLGEALRGWQELKDSYLTELTARQIKRAQADAKCDEAFAFVEHGTKESLQAALLKFDEARRVYSELGDKQMEANTLNSIGVVYSELGERQKALEYYNRTLPLRKAVHDKKREATTLNSIGKVYSDLGEYQKALDFYNQSLPLCKAVGDQGGEATTLNNIGLAYSNLGEKQKALEYYNQALPLRKAVDDKKGEANTLHSIGLVHSELGENQKALEYLDQALALSKAVDDKKGEATTLNTIGLVYSHLGENQKALDYYKQALALRKVTGDRRGEATTLNNMGVVYWELGENQEALDYYNQALALRKVIDDRKGEAYALSNVGVVYSDLGENLKALDYYNQALALRKAVGDKYGEGHTLNSIGLAYSELGEKQKALEYLNQALPLFRALGDRNGEAAMLNNIGGVYWILGENQKALEYLNQALPLSKIVGDRRGEANTLNSMMYVWESLTNRRLAILYGKQSVNVYQSLRADIKGLDKNLQQRFLGRVEDPYRHLAALLIREGRIPEAEQILAMLKEEEYFQFVRRDGDLAAALDKRINLSPSEKDALQRYDRIAGELTQLGNEYAKLETEKNQSTVTPEKAKAILAEQKAIDEKLTSARIALDKFLEALKEEFSQGDKRIASVEEGLQSDVKGWNDPHAVVISTIVGKDNLSLIVTTSDIQTAHIVPISEERLNALVGEFRAALTDARSDPKPAAQKLYDVLIKPLQKDLDGVQARTLVWSLDGNLRYAPMSALWDADKGYLVQRYASVVITLASRGNLALRPEGKTKWQALGVGVSKAVGGFDALGNVPGELSAIVRDSSVVSIAKQIGVMAGRRLLDEQFTYDAFRSNLGRFPIVHAATHFSFVSGVKDESLESFLLLGNGEKLTLATIQKAGTIFNGVQLLALSACDTAYGGKDADGREVEGFGAMAQKKGAKAVLATLWRVADESTRDLMTEFYGDYQKPNFTKAEALRQAQLALLKEPDKAATGKTTKSVNASPKRFAHPYYWSPFILIGNWR